MKCKLFWHEKFTDVSFPLFSIRKSLIISISLKKKKNQSYIITLFIATHSFLSLVKLTVKCKLISYISIYSGVLAIV